MLSARGKAWFVQLSTEKPKSVRERERERARGRARESEAERDIDLSFLVAPTGWLELDSLLCAFEWLGENRFPQYPAVSQGDCIHPLIGFNRLIGVKQLTCESKAE